MSVNKEDIDSSITSYAFTLTVTTSTYISFILILAKQVTHFNAFNFYLNICILQHRDKLHTYRVKINVHLM